MSIPVLLLFGSLLSGWLGFGVFSGTTARLAKFLCVVLLAAFLYLAYNGGDRW